MESETAGASLELADLVHALSRHGLRNPLLVFAILGTLLVLGRRYLASEEPPLSALVVVVEPSATADEVERATDEAILLSFAIRAGFGRRDPAVRDRLVRNLRFVDASLAAEDAFDEAIRLEMHRSDPIARQRLLWIATQTIAALTRSPPADQVLQQYIDEHSARFRRPPTLSFEQVFVSRERHREGFETRVQWLSERIDGRHSDPSLLPIRMMRASAARIDARFGAGFSDRLFSLAGQGWSTAIPSAFGAHYVRVLGRRSGLLPPLDQLRERARQDYARDSQDARVRSALRRMRAAYRIVIESSS